MALTKVIGSGVGTLASNVAVTSDDPTITMTDSSGTNDIVTLQSTSGALIVTARDGSSNGEIIFKADTGSAVTEHMRINNIGAVTKPLQPAFCVTKDGPLSNLSINASTTVTWQTERFDQNSDFSSNTFTAPVTGKYALHVILYFLQVDADTTYVETILVTSNDQYSSIFNPTSFDADSAYHTIQINVIADMDANDTAYVRVYLPNSGSAQMDINADSFFSGALIC
jgi:hypothetical protein